jgi:hypothetical protein
MAQTRGSRGAPRRRGRVVHKEERSWAPPSWYKRDLNQWYRQDHGGPWVAVKAEEVPEAVLEAHWSREIELELSRQDEEILL